MAEKKTLRITIAADGGVSVKVEGVAGSSCLDSTKFLEDALGGVIARRETTPEYYAVEGANIIETQKTGL